MEPWGITAIIKGEGKTSNDICFTLYSEVFVLDPALTFFLLIKLVCVLRSISKITDRSKAIDFAYDLELQIALHFFAKVKAWLSQSSLKIWFGHLRRSSVRHVKIDASWFLRSCMLQDWYNCNLHRLGLACLVCCTTSAVFFSERAVFFFYSISA